MREGSSTLTRGQCPLEIGSFGAQEKEALFCENSPGRTDMTSSPAEGEGTATSAMLGIAPLPSPEPGGAGRWVAVA